MVAVAEIYVDESGTHAGSPMLGVGGYIFKRGRAKAFSDAWRAELRSKKLPYFHMTDCTKRAGVYKGWSTEACIAHEKLLISLVRQYSEFGFAMLMSEEVFNERINRSDKINLKAYTVLLAYCLASLNYWFSESNFKGSPKFIFESGHAHASEARSYLKKTTAEKGKSYSSAPFVFADKLAAPPLQAADLLVWLARNAVLKMIDGKPVRRDYLALTYDKHKVQYWDKPLVDAVVSAAEGDWAELINVPKYDFEMILPV